MIDATSAIVDFKKALEELNGVLKAEFPNDSKKLPATKVEATLVRILDDLRYSRDVRKAVAREFEAYVQRRWRSRNAPPIPHACLQFRRLVRKIAHPRSAMQDHEGFINNHVAHCSVCRDWTVAYRKDPSTLVVIKVRLALQDYEMTF